MNRRLAGIVCGALLAAGVALVGFVTTAQSAATPRDPKTDRPVPASAREAVDVMWRFDGSGRFPNIHPVSEWRRDKNILWQTPVEVGGYSSPIVARDRVFVTAEMGSLICLALV